MRRPAVFALFLATMLMLTACGEKPAAVVGVEATSDGELFVGAGPCLGSQLIQMRLVRSGVGEVDLSGKQTIWSAKIYPPGRHEMILDTGGPAVSGVTVDVPLTETIEPGDRILLVVDTTKGRTIEYFAPVDLREGWVLTGEGDTFVTQAGFAERASTC